MPADNVAMLQMDDPFRGTSAVNDNYRAPVMVCASIAQCQTPVAATVMQIVLQAAMQVLFCNMWTLHTLSNSDERASMLAYITCDACRSLQSHTSDHDDPEVWAAPSRADVGGAIRAGPRPTASSRPRSGVSNNHNDPAALCHQTPDSQLLDADAIARLVALSAI